MDNEKKSEMEQVIRLAQQSVRVQDILRPSDPDVTHVAFIPENGKVVPLDDLFPKRPDRIRATVKMVNLASFVNYMKEHKCASSRVFAQVMQGPFRLVCALDWHGNAGIVADDRPQFVTHKCVLEFTETDAWREWKANNGRFMPQDDFARFVEERQPDISVPNGADMLELARSIEATRDVSFKRRIRLDNGDVQFAFDEKTDATAGMNGQLRIPDKITLNIALFYGMVKSPVDARFRYKLEGGRLLLAYEIVRLRELQLTVIESALERVMADTNVPVFMGMFE